MNDPLTSSGQMGTPSLGQRHCAPCEAGQAPLTASEIGLLAGSVPGWRVVDENGVKRLVRSVALPDFRAAIAFVNRVADLAEAEGHHPDLLICYRDVTVSSWTHVAQGLTENDFILAAKVNALLVGIAGV